MEIRQKTKEKLSLLLSKCGERELSERVERCGAKFVALTCGRHIVGRRPFYNCENRLCPHCASRRSRKISRKYLPMLAEFARSGVRSTPVHLVLTQAHRSGERLPDARKRLMSSFKKLVRREFFKRFFAGGVYAFETTIGTDGLWHCHLHLLAFRRRFFDISMLRAEWKQATGDSHVLRLDAVRDIQTGLREVLKYISKPGDVEKFQPRHVRQLLELRGAKLFGAFGEFARFCRKFDADDVGPGDGDDEVFAFCEGDACPKCDEPLFEMILTVGELIGLMRTLEQSGFP